MAPDVLHGMISGFDPPWPGIGEVREAQEERENAGALGLLGCAAGDGITMASYA